METEASDMDELEDQMQQVQEEKAWHWQASAELEHSADEIRQCCRAAGTRDDNIEDQIKKIWEISQYHKSARVTRPMDDAKRRFEDTCTQPSTSCSTLPETSSVSQPDPDE